MFDYQVDLMEPMAASNCFLFLQKSPRWALTDLTEPVSSVATMATMAERDAMDMSSDMEWNPCVSSGGFLKMEDPQEPDDKNKGKSKIPYKNGGFRTPMT